MLKAILKLVLIATAVAILSSCNSGKTIEENRAQPEHRQADSIKNEKVETWVPIIKDDHLQIEGHSNVKDTMIQSVKVKFEPYIWFEDFPAPSIDTVSRFPLNFNSNREAKHYITAIKNGYKEPGSNFGGHYVIVMWGCGAPCAAGVIVDRRTGNIYDIPHSAGGYEYRYNSLMLIVNPTDEAGFYDLLDFFIPEIYVFDETKKQFKELDKKGR